MSAAAGARVPGVAAALFFLVALVTALGRLDRIDDEGYATFVFARALFEEPIAGLFWLRSRPFIAAFYAGPAGLGWTAFVVAHVAVGALGIWLLARAVQRLGGAAWAAAAVVALSPMYFLAAVSGQSNSDGVAAMALVLFFYSGRSTAHRVLAGLALAAALFGRYEYAPFLLGLFAHAALRRRDGLLIGVACAAGLLYWAGGAAYHRELLWPALFQPEIARPEPYDLVHFDNQRLTLVHLGDLALRLAAVTPVWLVPLAVRWSRAGGTARWLAALLALELTLMVALPALGGIFYFQHTARYFLVLLPALALSAGLAVRHPAVTWRSAAPVLGACGLALALLWKGAAALGPLPLALPGAVLATRALRGRLVLALVPLLFVVSLAGAREQLDRTMPHKLALLDWLEAQADGRPNVYSSLHEVGPGLSARSVALTTRYLVNHETVIAVSRLTNPDNGQAARLAKAVGRHLYGRALWPCRLPTHGPVRDDLLVVEDQADEPIWSVFPIESWLEQTELAASFGPYTVRRFVVDRANTELPEEEAAREIGQFPCAL